VISRALGFAENLIFPGVCGVIGLSLGMLPGLVLSVSKLPNPSSFDELEVIFIDFERVEVNNVVFLRDFSFKDSMLMSEVFLVDMSVFWDMSDFLDIWEVFEALRERGVSLGVSLDVHGLGGKGVSNGEFCEFRGCFLKLGEVFVLRPQLGVEGFSELGVVGFNLLGFKPVSDTLVVFSFGTVPLAA